MKIYTSYSFYRMQTGSLASDLKLRLSVLWYWLQYVWRWLCISCMHAIFNSVLSCICCATRSELWCIFYFL